MLPGNNEEGTATCPKVKKNEISQGPSVMVSAKQREAGKCCKGRIPRGKFPSLCEICHARSANVPARCVCAVIASSISLAPFHFVPLKQAVGFMEITGGDGGSPAVC